MIKSKFFRFTIYGNDVDPLNIKEKIKLPCLIFFKGETTKKRYGDKEIEIKQRTNRWVYVDEQIDSKSTSKFLTKNLLVLSDKIDEIKCFIKRYNSKLELIVYADNKTDICLSKSQIKLLKLLGVKLYISFC